MSEIPLRTAHGRIPRLVAHRGYPLHYPENSIAGIRAALAAGAAGVECDVQLSGDRRPLIIHDADLRRTAGIAGDVRDMAAADLATIEVNETARFGPRFHGTHIPRLQEIVELASRHPAVTFFLDVKRASLRRFGNDVVLDAILAELGTNATSWVIVSFDRTLVERSRERSAAPVGWVLDNWSGAALRALHALAPDYVFCAARDVPAGAQLPGGRWRWVIYDVNDPAAALEYGARAADCVETDAIGEMLASPLLRPPPL